MIAVSTKFTNAQKADANLPVSKVQLMLGNYASSPAYGTTVASSSDFSSDYPAIGAIDGDRTELNIGPASGADDFVGLSSWRSGGIPDNGDIVTLILTFTESRILNYLKLYNLDDHGLRTYSLSYWTGTAWTVFAATADIATGSQTVITPTYELDSIDFTELSTTQIKLIVYHTQVAVDYANVVEIEFYRKIDITDRVKGVQVQRQRDYKLSNPMATTLALTLNNQDRYFSISHIPTAAEVADGFVNQELAPNVLMIIQFGFNLYGSADELVPSFTGYIDSIAIRPSGREARISLRDGMKTLINKIDTSNLKMGNEIGANILYLLNRANISTYETAIDVTPIIIDYFFIEATDILSAIRDLTQAAGDSLFYFDEYGIATFYYYAQAVPLQKIWTSEANFEAGTLTNIASAGGAANTIQTPTLFAPTLASGTLSGDETISGANLTLPSSSPYTAGSDAQSGAYQALVAAINAQDFYVDQPFSIPRAGTVNSVTVGPFTFTGGSGPKAYRIRFRADNGSGNPGAILYDSGSMTTFGVLVTVNPAVHVAAGTYYIEIEFFQPNNNFGIFSSIKLQSSTTRTNTGQTTLDGGATWQFLTDAVTGNLLGMTSSLTFTYDVVTKSGSWVSPWQDSESLFVGTPLTLIEACSYPAGCSGTTYVDGSDDGVGVVVTYTNVNFNGSLDIVIANHRYWRIRVALATTDNVNVPLAGPPTINWPLTGTWDSDVKDLGNLVTSFSTLAYSQVLHGGTVTYYTRSGAVAVPDGTWSAWEAIDGSNNIVSPVARYIQVRAVIVLTVDYLNTPVVSDITFNYVGGSGRDKYPAAPSSFTFSFDSNLLDVEQQLADNLGGDSSILNDVIVQAQPLFLDGTDADVLWELLQGTPPIPVSPINPYVVTIGTYYFYPVISGGMDVSRMSGANPAAAVFTSSGGAVFTWTFSQINQSQPVLKVVVTVGGNIDSLQIQGKIFSNSNNALAQQYFDAESIALYGDRQTSISNQWIVSQSIALYIATTLVNNFLAPFSYIPSAKVMPTFNIQIGDRVTVEDVNLDLSADYIAVGVSHNFSVGDRDANVETGLVLLKVPEGK